MNIEYINNEHDGSRRKSGFFQRKSDTGWGERAENVFLREYPFVKLLSSRALTNLSVPYVVFQSLVINILLTIY